MQTPTTSVKLIFNIQEPFIAFKDEVLNHLKPFKLSFHIDHVVHDLSHVAIHQACLLMHVIEDSNQKQLLKDPTYELVNGGLMDMCINDIIQYLDEAEYIIVEDNERRHGHDLEDRIANTNIEIASTAFTMVSQIVERFIHVFINTSLGFQYLNDKSLYIQQLEFTPMIHSYDAMAYITIGPGQPV